MSKKHPTNKAASVRDKLYNLSRKNGRNFQEIVQYYAMERFLFRLGQSEFQHSFILKGALMLRVWNVPQARATMDIDLLGSLGKNSSFIDGCIQKILEVPVPDDGLSFDPESVTSMSMEITGSSSKSVDEQKQNQAAKSKKRRNFSHFWKIEQGAFAPSHTTVRAIYGIRRFPVSL